MNLREKFIWNVALGFAFLTIIWSAWTLYNKNFDINILYENYNNEQVGTDDKLNSKVNQLEEVYAYRKKLKFKVKGNPFDLSRVVSGDDDYGRKSKVWVSGIMKKSDGTHMAILGYKNNTYRVVKGDSIDGGVISNITSTVVTYEKNDQLQYFNLGVDNNSK